MAKHSAKCVACAQMPITPRSSESKAKNAAASTAVKSSSNRRPSAKTSRIVAAFTSMSPRWMARTDGPASAMMAL